jgi:hypothetical protein
METIDFLRLTNFKLLNQSKAKNNCDFYKVPISARSGHCDYSPKVQKKLPRPLQCTKGGDIQTINDPYDAPIPDGVIGIFY